MTLPVIPILAAIATSLVGYAALGWIQDRVVSAGPVRRGLLLQLGIALAFVAIGLLLMRSAQVLGLALAAVGPAIGFLAPRALADRRDGAAKARMLKRIPALIAQLRALIAMGTGLEQALGQIAASPLTDRELGSRLRRTLAAYALGRPIDVALAELGRDLESLEIDILARSIAQARRLGTGLEETLARSEFEFSLARRRRVDAAAGRAQTRAQLLIAVCYLPAFLALVLAPLFIGMLAGLSA